MMKKLGQSMFFTVVLTTVVTTAATSQNAAERIKGIIEAHAQHAQVGDLAAMDTLWAPDDDVHIIEGAGVNHGWADYRDNHLGPELKQFRNLQYRYHSVEPQVRGEVAWASFQYDLSTDTPNGKVERVGRGTAVLERRGGKWLMVHLHTSGRAPRPEGC